MSAETKAEANVQQVVPFFMVADMDAALKFYVGGLGFEMKNQWIHEGKLAWCRLQIGGAELMLQEFPAKKLEHAKSAGKLGNGVTLCFQCKDALAIYREVTSRGIQAKEPFVGNRLWVVGAADPDGHRIEFASPTEVEEEAKLSEWKG